MEYPISDIVDRLSIVLLKSRRISASKFADELLTLENAMKDFEFKNNVWLERNLIDLIDVNGRIWDLEADIRQGKEGILGLEEVGRRALAIRDLNGKRIAYKNEIAKKVGGFEEVKKDHASE